MTTAREEILTRIRRALATTPSAEPPKTLPRDHRPDHGPRGEPAPFDREPETPRDQLPGHGPRNEPETTDSEPETSPDQPPEHGPGAEPAKLDLEAEISRNYLLEHGAHTEAEAIELLAENLADYRAQVHRSSAADLPGTIARLLAEHGSGSVVIPEGLPADWLAEIPSTVATIPDSADLTARRLDEVHAVVQRVRARHRGDGHDHPGRRSGAGAAPADAGAGPSHLRRAGARPGGDLRAAGLPRAAGLAPDRPQTWIAGPSATSDIELDRVEGVHGPRKLDVILVAP